MLSEFGKLGKTFGAKILFGLLLVSFVAWGISDAFTRNSSADEAARIGKKTVSLAELDRTYKQYIGNLRSRGMDISNEQARGMQLAESVLKSRIQRGLFSMASIDMGLKVDDATAAKEIRRQKIFQNDKGVFDRARYNTLLQQNGLTERDYVENLRLDTANNLLMSVLKTNIVVSDTEVQALHHYQNETRSAELRIMSFADAKNIAQPDDARLAAYLKDHQDKYKVPELRSFTIAYLPLVAVAQNIDISEQEIQAAYDARKDELKAPEERDFQFVSLPDRKSAQLVAEAARGGDKLLAAAKAHGATDAKLEILKAVKPGSLPAELEKIVFKMGRAETSDAIQTPLGWYVVQLLNVNRSETPALKDLHDKIKQSLQLSKAQEAIAKIATDLDDAMAGGASLEELAKTYNLRLSEITNVTEAGLKEDGTEEKQALKEALKTAFSIAEKQTGVVQELKSGDYIVVRLNSIKAAHVPAVADIKTRIAADWTAEERSRVTKARAEELRKAWADNKGFDELAKKYNAKPATISNVQRDSKESNATISPDLLVALFDLKQQNDVASGNVKNGVAVARLTNIANADSPKPDEIQKLRNQLQQQRQDAAFDAFLRQAETKHKVTINQTAIQSLYQR